MPSDAPHAPNADNAPANRSPEIMLPGEVGLLVVDVQTKLIGLIGQHRRIVWNIGRLLAGARLFDIPVEATEQYPQGLGGTVPELAQQLSPARDKTAFSCGACEGLFEGFRQKEIDKLLVCGIETHVCVQQTVLDALAEGFRVFVAADAVGARGQIDHDIALRRLEASGATLTTTEAALFEWCQTSGTPEFKQISELVKQSPPVDG